VDDVDYFRKRLRQEEQAADLAHRRKRNSSIAAWPRIMRARRSWRSRVRKAARRARPGPSVRTRETDSIADEAQEQCRTEGVTKAARVIRALSAQE